MSIEADRFNKVLGWVSFGSIAVGIGFGLCAVLIAHSHQGRDIARSSDSQQQNKPQICCDKPKKPHHQVIMGKPTIT
ncbi:MAG: hypothetical protein PHE96_01080 [Methylococcales bacterium]|nr:hypothetical protein [Methylococcales bacterium]